MNAYLQAEASEMVTRHRQFPPEHTSLRHVAGP